MPDPKHVYQAISAITLALSKEGIKKGRQNKQQGYAFRGIDDVYSALAALLAEQSLCIIPRCTERIATEREAKSGGALFGVTVAVEFDLVSGIDGSTHTARMYGEAMDSADKATNKAMSAAYKYMALEVFCIPTEGDNDADAHTPEPVATTRTYSSTDPLKLPGDSTKFQGHGGKALTDLTITPDELASIGRYFTKNNQGGKNTALVEAIALELDRRRELVGA